METPTIDPGAGSLRTVGVKFRVAGTIYTFDAGHLDLAVGEEVMVQTEHGLAMGVVATLPEPTKRSGKPPARVLKKADGRDHARVDAKRRREQNAHAACVELAQSLRFAAKIVKVESALDGSRTTVFFYSEKPIDYRGFARDLAARLRTRIEMKSIGARDQAKMIGAMGPCGRELCCSSWLREFHAVSVKMAKAQDLSLNPSRLAGMCGRLKCCLRYEYETYLELRRGLPRPGSKVLCVKGDGVVVRQIPLRQSVVIRREEDDVEVEATLEDLVAERSR